MYKCSICSSVDVPSVNIYTTDEPDYTPPDNLYQRNQQQKSWLSCIGKKKKQQTNKNVYIFKVLTPWLGISLVCPHGLYF